MFDKIKDVLVSKWFLTLLGLILLSLVIWFIGPLIEIANVAFLAPVLMRTVIIVGMFIVWGVVRFISAYREMKKNQGLIDTLEEQAVAERNAAAQTQSLKATETSAIDERFETALKTLKSTKLGEKGEYLYQLPWYAIIGPPGSGKTTALLNSGLDFPLAEHGKANAVKGQGGTRYCDWWFADQAILIDTAGRYTTQDSDAVADASGWLGFLDLLKKRRPQRPLNGIIVAIAATDFMSGDAESLKRHADAIRDRLDEINQRLNISLPVYFVVTKCDLVNGFTEFFEDLGKEDREQVWGITFDPVPATPLADQLSVYASESDEIGRRLARRLLTRMKAETDMERRRAIFSFPQGFAALRREAASFINSALADNRYQKKPFLRGVYFTSATQEGAPIDRLLGNLSSGILGGDKKTLGRSTEKSFFLTDLLQEVIFGEAELAGGDGKAIRAKALRHYGAVAAGLALLGVFAAIWSAKYFEHSSYVAGLGDDVAAIKSEVATLPTERVADLRALVPLLNEFRTTAYIKDGGSKAAQAGFAFGLSPKSKVRNRVGAKYEQALNKAFLPRILSRLEGQLDSNVDDPEAVYEILRVYLMAGGQGPLDREAILSWLAVTWQADYPGGSNDTLRESLLAHAQELYARPIDSAALDQTAVERARAVIRTMDPAKIAFSQLKYDDAAVRLGNWQLLSNAGPEVAGFFQIANAATQPSVPGIFTRDGYLGVVKPRIAQLVAATQGDNWIMGNTGLAERAADGDRLYKGIEQLYFSQFISEWRNLFQAVEIAPLDCGEGRAAASDCLRANADRAVLAAGPASPLRSFLTSAAAATDLSPEEQDEKLGAALDVASDIARRASTTAARVERRAGRVVGGQDSGTATVEPIDAVIKEYEPLRKLVASEGDAGSALDRALDVLGEYAKQLDKSADEFVDGEAKAAARGTASRFERLAEDLPQPADRLLTSLVSAGSTVVSSQSRSQLNEAFAGGVGSDCASAIAGRYPFTPGAAENLLLGDFSNLFGPTGAMANYFDENLRRYVITATKPWSLTPEAEEIGLTRASIRRFETADNVRKAYFSSGALGANYTLDIVTLDPKADRVRLSFDGDVLENAHTPSRPISGKWPAAPGEQGVRISFDSDGASRSAKSWTGEWALFRFLDDATVIAKSPAEVTFQIEHEGLSATFLLRAESVNNPFTSDIIRRVSCAGKL